MASLNHIHMLACVQAANASVKPPTAPADHQAQPQGGAKRHRVQFQELDAEDPHSDVDEETAEQDEEEHVPKPSQALVVRWVLVFLMILVKH